MANIIVEDCFLWKRKRWSAHNCYPSSYLGHVTRLPTIQNDRRLDESVFPYNTNTHTVLPANSMIPLLARTIRRANTSPHPNCLPPAPDNRRRPIRTSCFKQMPACPDNSNERRLLHLSPPKNIVKKEAFKTISDGPFERLNIEIFTSLPPKIFSIGCRSVH